MKLTIGHGMRFMGLVLLTAHTLMADPLGTAFTYQGSLKNGGSPASGNFNMDFALFDGPTGGTALATQSLLGVAVTNGLFTVQLDFGNTYNGDKRWLDITVNGMPLTPRQELTPAPYAHRAMAANSATSAASAQTVPWSGITGVPDNIANAFSLWTVASNQLTGWGMDQAGETTCPPGTFVAVAAGYQFSLAIRSDGTLAGWGTNFKHEINVPSGTFIAVAAGTSHGLAIRSDGTLAGWGFNQSGQATVPSGTFIAVAAGTSHSVAIRNDGTLVGWGGNGSGQINVPSGTFIAVAAGGNFCLAIRSDGTLAGWGNNGTGQLNVPSGTFTAVAAGDSHGLAIRSDGTLVGWGDSIAGQNNVPSGTFTAVAEGSQHCLAIRSDGTLAGWGYNHYGQTDVPSDPVTAIAGGNFHSLAIRNEITSSHPLSVQELSVSDRADFNDLRIFNDIEIRGSRLHVDGHGMIGIGTATPGQMLSVAGNIETTSGGFKFPDGSYQTTAAVSGQWSSSGNNISYNTGNVGIGTDSPATRLHVSSDSDTEVSVESTAASGRRWTMQSSATAGLAGTFQIIDRTEGACRLLINSSGNVGLGSTSPAQKLVVAGNICATGSIATCSDERYKKNITSLESGLSLVEKLRPVRFDWKREEFPDHKFAEGRQIGFIAQEVEEVLPQVVLTGSDGYKAVDYGRLTPVIVEAVKQIKSEKDEQIESLRTANAELKARLERIESLINKVSN